jgi:transcriptional regulator GlxA family with amidase domain
VAKTPEKTIIVGLVVVAESAPAVLYGLQEVFAFAGSAWETMTGKPAGNVRLVPRLVAEHKKLMTCALGAPIRPDEAFTSDLRCDVVIVSDLVLEPEFDPRGHWHATARWLREQTARGAVVCSVCTGSVLLAEAGLLDGVEATSHWGSIPLLERCYPNVRLKPERVLCLAGPEQRIVTSGGYASWSELALYLIARFCGREEAVRTSKVFLLGDRSDGQLPFAAMARPREHFDQIIADCQVWIADHYSAANPVARMVAKSGLPARTFKRRFQTATGYAPIEYVQTLRVEEAKHILETTTTATDEVAEQVGYEDPASFRRIFKRMTGLTPARYRQRYRMVGELPTK